MRRFYFALLPWAVFDIALRSGGLSVVWGAAIGLVSLVALLLFTPERLQALGLGSAAIFLTVLILALLDNGGAQFRAQSRWMVAAAMSALFLVSALAVPLLDRFMREVTAPRHWSEPLFRSFSVRYTVAWGLAFACIALLDLLAIAIPGPLAATMFNWLLPIGLFLALGLEMDRAVTARFDRDEPTVGELVRNLQTAASLPERGVASRRLHLYRGDAPSG